MIRPNARIRRLVASAVPTRVLRAVEARRRRRTATALERSGGVPVCDDVAAWAVANGRPVRRVLEASEGHRNLPHTIEPEVLPVFRQRLEARHGARDLVELDGARLIGRTGLVFLPDGRLVSASVFGNAVLEAEPEFSRVARRRRVTKPGRYFSLLVLYAREGIYYHWVHDTLELLAGVLDVLPPDTRFIVPATLRPYQHETLRVLGIDDRLEPFSGDEVWDLETLFFAPPAVHSGSNRTDVDVWLRDRFFDAYSVVPVSSGRRIYLTRREQARRRVRNEAAVEETMRRYGFETVAPESLPLAEQVALFAECEAVVSTHGSALTNILFAPTGLKVLDIVEPGMSDLAYIFWSLSEPLGHEYWYFLTESVEQVHERANEPVVDIEKLTASLDSMGLGPPA